MTADAKNMLRESLIPVLVGDCPRAHLLAARIYFRTGIVSYVCDEKRSPLSFIDPFSKYFPLFSRSHGGVALDSLKYAASCPDYLPLLVICDNALSDFVEKYRDALEASFIIADRKTLFDVPPLSELL